MTICKKKHIRGTALFGAVLLMAGLVPTASAQNLSDYTLRYDTVAFQTIVGTEGCHRLAAAYGDSGYDTLSMPFAFPFGEESVAEGTRVAASSNGFLWFGNSSLGDYAYSQYTSYSSTERLIVPLVQADGFCRDSIWYADTTDELGRVLVFEFRGITTYGGRNDSGVGANYQVRLYADGRLAVHFDTTALPVSANRTLTIVNTSADKLCLTGSWVAPVASMPSSIPSLEGLPVAGARYTFLRPEGYCTRPQAFAVDSVGADWVALSWTGEASRYVLYWSASATEWSYDTVVGGHAVVLDSLSPSTLHYFALASLCGDTVYSTYTQLQARTACLPITDLPYSEDFESYDVGQTGFNPCWSRFFRESNGQLSESNPIGTSDAYGGERAMRLYAHPGYGQWTLVALPDVENYDPSQLQLSFFCKGNRATNNVLEVGVMENLADTGSFVAVDTVDLGTEWTLAEVNLGSYSGNGSHVAMRYSSAINYGYETYYCFIDDLMLSLPPACVKPQGVTVVSVDTRSAELAIADSTFAMGDDYVVTLTSASDTAVVLTTSASYVLTDLRPGIRYEASVAKRCADGTLTRPVAVVFTTPCEPLTHSDLPYTENFDSYETGQGGFTNSCWTILNHHPSGNYPMPSSFYYHGTTGNSLYFYANRGSEGQFASLPPVDFIGDLSLHFYSYCSNSVSRLEVGYMSDPHDTTTFTAVYTVTPGGSSWEEHEVGFAGVADSNLCIAFRNYHTSLATGYYICIDDVELHTAPSCLRPVSVSADSVWSDGMRLTVVDPAEQDSYRVWFGEDDSVDVQDHSVVLTGLLSGTTYTVRVATLCDDLTLTAAVETTATTLCATLDSTALPWSEDFEAWQPGIYAPFNPCWQRHYGADSMWSPYPESKVRVMAEGETKALELKSEYTWSDGALMAVAVLPEVDVDVRRLEVAMRLKFYSAEADEEDFVEVGVVADGSNPASFVAADTIRHPGNNRYATYRSSLADSPLSEGVVALRYHYGVYNDYNMVYIDSIGLTMGAPIVVDTTPDPVEPDTCAMVQGLAVDSIGESEATIAWQRGEASGWEVMIDGGDAIVVEDTFFVATGLRPATEYSVVVRTLCSDTLYSDWSEALVFRTEEHEEPEEPVEPVGIGEVDGEALTVAPNPAVETVTVSGLAAGARLTLLSADGHVCGEWTATGASLTLPLGTLPRGAYFVRVTSGDGVKVVKLIVG